MASTHLCHRIFRPPQAQPLCLRRLAIAHPSGISLPPPKYVGHSRRLAVGTPTHLKWALRFSIVDQSSPTSTVDMNRLVNFLYDDLPHLFDDQGIDRTAYDEEVKFRDPITKHDSIGGYLFNIRLLKNLFRPLFQLHWVKQVWVSTVGVLKKMIHLPYFGSPYVEIALDILCLCVIQESCLHHACINA